MHDTASVNGNAARPARTKQPSRRDAAKRPAHRGRAPVTLEQQPSVASTDVAPQSAITASAPSETSHSLLPARYVAALKALEKCARIDECKALSDECAALKMYARQAKDPTLRLLTARIHARAVRRCGELLKTIPSSQGRKNLHGELPDGSCSAIRGARAIGLATQRDTAGRARAKNRCASKQCRAPQCAQPCQGSQAIQKCSGVLLRKRTGRRGACLHESRLSCTA